ncbi:MAG: DUF4123 domain-containing protein [Stenotrophomonas rhizophila]|uniref:DUF4123 domain-containing protein n=1 Tax=Stenotrophomonas rhizophila TaxID=216778 RepID=UPI00215ADD90|nr:DUF4123 domain-containing protein [Stenotrophomonas rhizophila]
MQLDHRLLEANQYALLSPLQVDKRIVDLWPSDPVVPAELKGQPHLFPRLLRLGEISWDKRLRALDEANDYARAHGRSVFSALISSTASPVHVRNHLAKMMIRRVEGERMLLRFYDPRVWTCLAWILAKAQIDSLLGPIDVWTCPGESQDQWIRYENTRSGDQAFLMDATQLTAISTLASVHRVAQRLRDAREDLKGSFPLSERIYAEIEQARDKGLADADDQESYAFISISNKPGIHQRPEYKMLIEKSRLEPGAYRSLASAICDQDNPETSGEAEPNGVRQHG